jgi:hypothetical protein
MKDRKVVSRWELVVRNQESGASNQAVRDVFSAKKVAGRYVPPHSSFSCSGCCILNADTEDLQSSTGSRI